MKASSAETRKAKLAGLKAAVEAHADAIVAAALLELPFIHVFSTGSTRSGSKASSPMSKRSSAALHRAA